MKFDRIKERAVGTRDAESYRKFLAGNKTLYAQAFWENGPLLSPKPGAESVFGNANSEAKATGN